MLSKRMLLALFITAVGLVLLISSVAAAPSLTPIQQLGKSIFFDTNLSLNNNQSCAACHAPESGWTGPDAAINAHGAVYEGSIPGAFGDRKPPSSAYATQSPILHLTKKGLFVGGNFWDGRATGEILGSPAAEQAKGDLATSVGLPLDQMPKGQEFKAAFDAAYPGETIAAYDAYSYDAANVIIKGIVAAAKELGADKVTTTDGKKAIIAAVAKTDFEGVTGKVQFDSKGDTTNKAITVYVVGADGTWGPAPK